MITKRQLGIGLMVVGWGAMVAIFVAGRLGLSNWRGVGPVEMTALAATMALGLAGIPLWRLRALPAAATRLPAPPARTTVAPTERWGHLLRVVGRGLAVVALILYLLYFAVYLTYAFDLFRWPYDYDQGEGFELYDAILHSQGEWPYRDTSTFPFYASNYPPVFHLLMIPLFPLFGQMLLAGRVLSFTATLINAALIGWIVWRHTARPYIALMSGLGFLASNFVYHVGPLCRQQMTMVLFETLVVLFIARAGEEQGAGRNTLIGLGLLVVAGYTKQLAIFTAFAVFIYLFLLNPKRAIALGVGFAAVFLLIFWGINLATKGQWWLNTIAANVNAYDFQQLIALTRSWFKIHTVVLLLAFAYLAYEVYWGRLSVYGLWFACAVGTGLLSGKWGAGEAYWNTSVAAALVLSGFALSAVLDWAVRRGVRWQQAAGLVLPLLFIIQATRMVHLPTEGPFWGTLARALGVQGRSAYADYPYYDAVGYTQVGHLMSAEDYEAGERIMAYIREAEGPVFSEEATFTLLAGKPVVTNPTQLLNLYNNQLLDTTEIEQLIRQEAFGLVLMRAQFYPPPVLAAIGQHYGLVEHVRMNGFDYIIMQPLGQPQP